MAERPRTLVLDPRDNVAVAVAELTPGVRLELVGARVTVRDPIPAGHKVALEDIDEGEAVRKYSEVIGVASEPIVAGAHVHVHNVVSARLPGPA